MLQLHSSPIVETELLPVAAIEQPRILSGTFTGVATQCGDSKVSMVCLVARVSFCRLLSMYVHIIQIHT